MYTKINKILQSGILIFLLFSIVSSAHAAESNSFILKEEVPNYGSNIQTSNTFSLFGDTTWHMQPLAGATVKVVAFDASSSSTASSTSSSDNEGGDDGGGSGQGSGKRKESIDRLVQGTLIQIVEDDSPPKIPTDIVEAPLETELEFAIHRNVPDLQIPRTSKSPVETLHAAALNLNTNNSSDTKTHSNVGDNVETENQNNREIQKPVYISDVEFDTKFMSELETMVRAALAADNHTHTDCSASSQTHILIYLLLLLILIVLFLIYYEVMQLKQEQKKVSMNSSEFSSCRIYGIEKKVRSKKSSTPKKK